jgi:ATP/maltotriose-dependent transcriptional regulator MalT
MAQRPEWVADHRADVDAFTGIKALSEIDRLLESSPDLARRGMVLFRLATFLGWDAGEIEEGQRLQRQAVELLKQGGDEGTARLAATELGFLSNALGDFEAGAQQAREVVQAAEDAGDMFAAMHALGMLGWAYMHLGDLAEADEAFQRAIGLARERVHLHRLTYGLVGLAATHLRAGRPEEARLALAEGRRVNPTGYWDTILLEVDVHLEWSCGRFDEAIAAARDSAARNPRGLSRRRGWALAIAAMAAVERGQLNEARDFLAAADVYGDRVFTFAACVPWAAGMLALRQGRLTTACQTLERAASMMISLDPAVAPFTLADLAEAAADGGDAAAAISAAERARATADRVGGDLQRGLAELAAGWAALTTHEGDSARTHGAAAVELLAGTAYVPHHGRALELLGRSLVVRERAAAVEALTEAVSVFDSCRATVRRERVLEELRRLGSRGRKAEAAARGPGSLTGRERAVVQLAVQGYTAREIGERLFIGKRTVETHLINAYAKLGVRSKRDLIKRAPELGLS